MGYIAFKMPMISSALGTLHLQAFAVYPYRSHCLTIIHGP